MNKVTLKNQSNSGRKNSDSKKENRPRITVKHAFLSYSGQKLLDDVSLEVYANEVVSVVGPSGTGKTALIKIIAGLIELDSGEIELSSGSIGVAFQSGALFTSMTVYENLIFVLEQTMKKSVSDMDQRIDEVLNLVGIGAKERGKHPSQLSNGMRKRVSIARALVIYPDIMLYDEPSSGFDPMFANKLEKDLKKFNQEHHMASIVVTNELSAIKNLADRVMMLYQGKIVYEGSNDDFFTTKAPFALQYTTHQETGLIEE
jgi:phospholipid/cholesterol/gamma-HCH transport system ATP-binding protein